MPTVPYSNQWHSDSRPWRILEIAPKEGRGRNEGKGKSRRTKRMQRDATVVSIVHGEA